MDELTLSPKEAYQALALFLEDYRLSLTASVPDGEPPTPGDGDEWGAGPEESATWDRAAEWGSLDETWTDPPDLVGPGSGWGENPPPYHLPYSHSFGDLVVSVTLLRNGTPVDPYLWESWRACLPRTAPLSARRAYDATLRFLDGYYGATGCLEVKTLRRWMTLAREDRATPALWDRWTACVEAILHASSPDLEQRFIEAHRYELDDDEG